MPKWRRIASWFGIGSPGYLYEAMAHRNLMIVCVGSAIVSVFAGMLTFCLVTGVYCPVDGFERAARESPEITFRYTVVCASILAAMIAIFVTSLLYLRRKWDYPHVAMVITVLFAFLMLALWTLSESGLPMMRQIVVFASIQFLAAGLLVFGPVVSLAYFVVTFFLFSAYMDFGGQMMGDVGKDLNYLALVDIVVSWVVCGLFVIATEREHAAQNQSRRDELTGAKNRHALRNDFATYQGADLFVMLCDVDDFKHFNDGFGHEVGDELLRQFYFALREAFGDECVYRYGGDEFLVVSPEMGSAEFDRRAQKVIDQLSAVEIEGVDARLTYTGGYARGHFEVGEDFRTLLHTADERLLKAKASGKNQLLG